VWSFLCGTDRVLKYYLDELRHKDPNFSGFSSQTSTQLKFFSQRLIALWFIFPPVAIASPPPPPTRRLNTSRSSADTTCLVKQGHKFHTLNLCSVFRGYRPDNPALVTQSTHAANCSRTYTSHVTATADHCQRSATSGVSWSAGHSPYLTSRCDHGNKGLTIQTGSGIRRNS
jgi:hypothetical protein